MNHLTDLSAAQAPVPSPMTLEVNFEKYLPYTKDYDLTEDQKRELIAALWNIMIAHVDHGFGIDATTSACGQFIKSLDHCASAPADMVEYNDPKLTGEFNDKRGSP